MAQELIVGISSNNTLDFLLTNFASRGYIAYNRQNYQQIIDEKLLPDLIIIHNPNYTPNISTELCQSACLDDNLMPNLANFYELRSKIYAPVAIMQDTLSERCNGSRDELQLLNQDETVISFPYANQSNIGNVIKLLETHMKNYSMASIQEMASR